MQDDSATRAAIRKFVFQQFEALLTRDAVDELVAIPTAHKFATVDIAVISDAYNCAVADLITFLRQG